MSKRVQWTLGVVAACGLLFGAILLVVLHNMETTATDPQNESAARITKEYKLGFGYVGKEKDGTVVNSVTVYVPDSCCGESGVMGFGSALTHALAEGMKNFPLCTLGNPSTTGVGAFLLMRCPADVTPPVDEAHCESCAHHGGTNAE